MSQASSSKSPKSTEITEDLVTLSDLISNPGDQTTNAGWARNLSVVPMDLEEILKSILEKQAPKVNSKETQEL